MKSASTAASTDIKPSFIPASSWEGSKLGYVFTTGPSGTGYYIDQVDRKRPPDDSSNSNGNPRKRPRKSVQIAENKNETRVIPSSDQLLQEAEQLAKSTKVLDLTPRGLRKAAGSLLKAVENNEIQRAEHPEEPELFMDSEVALYEHIASFKALAADPVSAYPIALEHDVVATLLQLLLHANVDIVATTMSTLLELMETSLAQDEESGETIVEVVAVASKVLQDGAETLVSNLSRLDDNENDDEVGRGLGDLLSLLENLMDLDRVVAFDDNVSMLPNKQSVAAFLCRETSLLSWLLTQIENNEPLRDRSLEILATIAPREDVYEVVNDWSNLPPFVSSFEDNQEKEPQRLNGIEILLQIVGKFRKHQPDDEVEVDRLENACLIVTSALTFSVSNLRSFLDAQGVELALRCLKERVHAGETTLKWLDFSGSDPAYREACHHMIDAGIFKYLFAILMGKHIPKPADSIRTKKARKEWQKNVLSTCIRILYALTRFIDDESPNDSKARLLAKFATDPAKCDRIVDLLLSYDVKSRTAEYKFYRSDVEEALDEDEVELAAQEAKLSGGGDIFHRLGAVAAFLSSGSKRCHERLLQQLKHKESGMGLIREAVSEFVVELEEGLPQRQQLEAYLKDL